MWFLGPCGRRAEKENNLISSIVFLLPQTTTDHSQLGLLRYFCFKGGGRVEIQAD